MYILTRNLVINAVVTDALHHVKLSVECATSAEIVEIVNAFALNADGQYALAVTSVLVV